jgi:hypothetical protein
MNPAHGQTRGLEFQLQAQRLEALWGSGEAFRGVLFELGKLVVDDVFSFAEPPFV